MTLAPLANAVEAYRYQQILTNMKQATTTSSSGGSSSAQQEEQETPSPVNKCRVGRKVSMNEK